jgi:hypothetical protein
VELAQHDVPVALQACLFFIGQLLCAPFVQQPVKPTDAMKAMERSVMMDFILGENVAEKTVCATRRKELSSIA